MKNNNKGFSLVELIVVIAIMAILAAIAIPTFAHFITKANEASDAELLNNINYIFNAACVENGVDVKDVTAATWNKTDKKVENVKVNGVDNDDIEASFVLHFGEMKNENFILIEDIVFDPAKHEFVDSANAGSLSVSYGGGYIHLNSSDITALNNSTFGAMGMGPLMNQLDDVTVLVSEMLGDDEATLGQIIASDDFLACVAETMNIKTEGVDPAVWKAEVANKYGELVVKYWAQQDPPVAADDITDAQRAEAQAKIQSNALVLYTAKQSADKKATGEFYSLSTSGDQIINNMKNPDTHGDGVAQAAMMCGLYTAYVNQEGYEGDKTVNAAQVLAALSDPESGFNAYLKTEQAETDLEGYIASLNMVNSSTSDYDAVSSLMINGFADPELIEGLNQAARQ